jgi:hypothetical protein
MDAIMTFKINAINIPPTSKIARTALRCFFAIATISILTFYGILFPAALVNLPDSWLGIVYTVLGISIGIACLINLKSQNWIVLILATLALVPVLWTLWNFAFH